MLLALIPHLGAKTIITWSYISTPRKRLIPNLLHKQTSVILLALFKRLLFQLKSFPFNLSIRLEKFPRDSWKILKPTYLSSLEVNWIFVALTIASFGLLLTPSDAKALDFYTLTFIPGMAQKLAGTLPIKLAWATFIFGNRRTSSAKKKNKWDNLGLFLVHRFSIHKTNR